MWEVERCDEAYDSLPETLRGWVKTSLTNTDVRHGLPMRLFRK